MELLRYESFASTVLDWFVFLVSGHLSILDCWERDSESDLKKFNFSFSAVRPDRVDVQRAEERFDAG